ncbi:MAG: aspartyl protease family protein [Deltaproteobacteria bacterium]|nr:aspartyl protease family protein [Deltaproteobacteria bacterium]
MPDVGPVRLMIDTGAQRTLVDDALCVKLGLPPIRFDEIVGVSGKPESWPVYLLGVRLGLSSHPKAQENAFAVFGAEVIGMPVGPHDQHRGLLGRDFLANFELGYDGPNGSFAIMVPATRAAALAGPTATPNRAERRRLARQKTGP